MNKRRRLTGVVTSNKMMKTVIVEVSRTYRHPLYEKVVHSAKKFKVHDELDCQVGDEVLIVECKPISKQKRFMVQEILQRHEESALEAPVSEEV